MKYDFLNGWKHSVCPSDAQKTYNKIKTNVNLNKISQKWTDF